MKKNILALLLIAGISILNAQTYVLDSTFGDSGVKFYSGNSFFPFKGLVSDGNYYLSGADRITKVDNNGNIVTGFGTSGFISISPSAWGSYSISDIMKA
ncbi:MAG TPA: hypothetical protein VK476_05705, partial [Flavobacterium sp.]|nr:hypothetical protein [Flavobacterium sp.]